MVADEHADEEGAVKFMSGEMLDGLCGCTGLSDAMETVGWLVQCEGGLQFPEYQEHNGSTGKGRAMAQKRKKKERHGHVTQERDTSVTRGEERRVEKKRREKNPTKKTPAVAPLPFSSPEFSEAWNDWESVRKEKKKPITPTAKKLQCEMLAKMGESRAIATLKHSTAGSYAGLFEPDSARDSAKGEIFRDGMTRDEYKRAHGLLRQGPGR